MKSAKILLAAAMLLSAPARADWVHRDGAGNIDGHTLLAPPLDGTTGAALPGWSQISGNDVGLTSWSAAQVAAAAEQAQVATTLAAGVAVVSTSDAGMDGTYATDATAQSNLTAAYASCGIRQQFPDGTTSNYVWYDIGGQAHVIPDCTHMEALAQAIAAYVSQVIHGGSPGQPLSIP